MGETTEIAWTDATFNPWWGCVRVSPGCERCYAETFAKRVGLSVWGVQAERRVFGDKHWNEPLKWNRDAAKAGMRKRVFCASMADVFEGRDDLDAQRARLFALIEQTPHLDWQLLTKRPENFARFLPPHWLDAPRPNVWLGCTVEDQRRADERIHWLVDIPARVRFLSCEPLLERVVVQHWLRSADTLSGPREAPQIERGPARIHWVIVGGESGADARPFAIEWARDIVQQCRTERVAVFMKQLGARPTEREPSAWPNGYPHGDRSTRLLGDGFGNHAVRGLKHRAGADPSEWPADLRVREFPEGAS